jgi:hypothetical protein
VLEIELELELELVINEIQVTQKLNISDNDIRSMRVRFASGSKREGI